MNMYYYIVIMASNHCHSTNFVTLPAMSFSVLDGARGTCVPPPPGKKQYVKSGKTPDTIRAIDEHN